MARLQPELRNREGLEFAEGEQGGWVRLRNHGLAGSWLWGINLLDPSDTGIARVIEGGFAGVLGVGCVAGDEVVNGGLQDFGECGRHFC